MVKLLSASCITHTSSLDPLFSEQLQTITWCEEINTTHLTSDAERLTPCGRSHIRTRRPWKETKLPLPCFTISTLACNMRCKLVFTTFCLESGAMDAVTIDRSFTLSFECVNVFTSNPVTKDIHASRRIAVHCSRTVRSRVLLVRGRIARRCPVSESSTPGSCLFVSIVLRACVLGFFPIQPSRFLEADRPRLALRHAVGMHT